MPSPETFGVGPISCLLDRWREGREVVIDPFARNSRRGSVRNDLNPATDAEFHLPAEEFADGCCARGLRADAVLFDPPYSARQVAEVYQAIGRDVTEADTQNGRLGKRVKDALGRTVVDGGVAICCGWNSSGFGLGRGFELVEILLVAHGGAHNDTIVTVEQKRQSGLFDGA